MSYEKHCDTFLWFIKPLLSNIDQVNNGKDAPIDTPSCLYEGISKNRKALNSFLHKAFKIQRKEKTR